MTLTLETRDFITWCGAVKHKICYTTRFGYWLFRNQTSRRFYVIWKTRLTFAQTLLSNGSTLHLLFPSQTSCRQMASHALTSHSAVLWVILSGLCVLPVDSTTPYPVRQIPESTVGHQRSRLLVILNMRSENRQWSCKSLPKTFSVWQGQRSATFHSPTNGPWQTCGRVSDTDC